MPKIAPTQFSEDNSRLLNYSCSMYSSYSELQQDLELYPTEAGKGSHFNVKQSLQTGNVLHEEQAVKCTLSEPYGEEHITITNEAQVYEWKGYGLSVNIPDNCLACNLSSARLDLKVSTIINCREQPISSVASVHIDHEPISAIYSIDIGEGRLCKPIILRLQHCLESIVDDYSGGHNDELLIFHAHDENTPFQPIKTASFDQSSSYGTVSVPTDEFHARDYHNLSSFFVAIRLLFWRRRDYKALVFKSVCKPPNMSITMHFVITAALDACTSVSFTNVSVCICM